VEPGCERALAAALGGRLRAALVDDLPAAAAALDRAGADGGRAIEVGGEGGQGAPAGGGAGASAPETTAGGDALASPSGASPSASGASRPGGATASSSGAAPAPGATPLGELVRGPAGTVALARRLLARTWLVDALDALPDDFDGIAVTREGRVWHAGAAELRQAPEAGEERILAQRNRRDELIASSEAAVRREHEAQAEAERASAAVGDADRARDEADRALRDADRARTAAQEDVRRAAWLIEERRKAPQQGAAAVRRAQLEGELAAERRVAERAERERAERARHIEALARGLAADEEIVPVAERLAGVLERVGAAIANRVEALDAELAADRAVGEDLAARLRACAGREAETQRRLRDAGEAVTRAEVRAQQLRDQAAEANHELVALAERLGLEATPSAEPLDDEQAHALRGRIERLNKRREQLGPVNPLAKAEYEEALAHVEELERQRVDLETALRELHAFIRDTDKQIRETFEETFAAAAHNFEELATHLFPGGRGRLRLVREDVGPRPVLGGEEPRGDDAVDAAAEGEEAAAELEEGDEEDHTGVEIEITPAGKSMKRLTLLSGGEKSMTALAFLFSVFLARPCPFYILDEVEAALDDLNIDRFLGVLGSFSDRAQFIVVTHQKRTMEAADCLYGVSMAGNGVSRVISRRLPPRREEAAA
jgi:chromosome segregation protein